MGEILGGLVDRPEFRDTEFPEGFLNGGDAAQLPAQTVWNAGVLTQYKLRN